MSLLLVPWIVLAISVFIALRLPLGRDLSVPIFLAPWQAFAIDVGARVELSQAVLLVLALKYVARSQFTPRAIPSLGLIIAIVLIGVGAAAITFTTHSVDIVFVGGEFRNGPLRTLVVLVVFALAIIPFALINARGARISVIGLLRVYVRSVLVLCVLGIVQYLAFRATGNDIFPIGIFDGDPERYKTGLMHTFGGVIMRPSSLAGEPKGLAMVTGVAAVLIIGFGKRMFRSWKIRYASLLLFLVILYLAQSTSAFVSFGLGIMVFFGLRSLGRPLARSAILIGYVFGTAAITAIYFTNVMTVPLDRDQRQIFKRIAQSESMVELIYHRSLGRMDVEDMDWVIIKSYMADPLGLVFGRGFGLGHLFTDPYIPLQNSYMIGTLNSPKSGITLFLVNGGAASLILFIFFLAKITPASNDIHRFQDPAFSDYVRRAQAVFITLVIMFMLRTYVFEVGLLLMAVMSSALRPKMPRPQQQMAARQRYAPNHAPSRPGSVAEPHSTNLSARKRDR